MALNFSEVNGSALKGGTFFKWTPGLNTFRMVGGILPRYMYWVTGTDKKNHPFECLGFDRDQERFTNVEMDWVQKLVQIKKDGEMVPAQCAWSYTCLAFDRDDGKLKVMPLKKKMTEAIIASAAKLGDPTSIDNGYNIIVDRVSTGSQAFNVEYRLDVLAMADSNNKSALTADELAAVEESPDITALTPRESVTDQKTRLYSILGLTEGSVESVIETSTEDNIDESAVADFDDDLPH